MHISVLQKELLTILNPQANENFVDATVDGGGNALAILERTKPEGKVLGIDWTPEIIRQLRLKVIEKGLEKRLKLVCDNFAHLNQIIAREKFSDIAGIILDLGLSSWHLETIERGFSFQKDEILDMRYNPEEPLTARDIVNKWSQAKLEKILRDYGEEKYYRRLAAEIIKARKVKPIETTQELVVLIQHVIPNKRRINPATKTFQALRIATNQELSNLEKVLPQAINNLKPGGKLAVISFHSLEDRIVKRFFQKAEEQKQGTILTKKAIVPQKQERQQNPRSRSAKLRILQKLTSLSSYDLL